MSETKVPAGSDLLRIDRMVHEPVRLRILSCLFVIESADFLFFMRQLQLTKGNLSSHMSKLEAAGYIEVFKDFVDKRPRSLLRLTQAGRAAFARYVADMKQFVDSVETPTRKSRVPGTKPHTAVTARRHLKPRTT